MKSVKGPKKLERLLSDNDIYIETIEGNNILIWAKWLVGLTSCEVGSTVIENAIKKAMDFWNKPK